MCGGISASLLRCGSIIPRGVVRPIPIEFSQNLRRAPLVVGALEPSLLQTHIVKNEASLVTFRCASTSCPIHFRQLLFNVSTTLNKRLINPLSQVQECFNV